MKEIAPKLLGYIEKSIESRADKGKSLGFAVGSKVSTIISCQDFEGFYELDSF